MYFDEVVIADDGSSDACVGEIKKLLPSYDFPIVHAWQPDKGCRISATRNNGIRHSGGDYLIFLDCDFLVLPGTIKCHLEAAKPGRFVGALCKYLSEEQSKRVFDNTISDSLLEELYSQMPESRIIKEHRRFIRRSILRKLRLASVRKQSLGGHFSIFRKDIETVNGFDENFVGWGGEDEDLGLRLLKAGIKGHTIIRYARALHIWHPKELGDKHWKEGPNVEYFRRKNITFFCDNGLVKKK